MHLALVHHQQAVHRVALDKQLAAAIGQLSASAGSLGARRFIGAVGSLLVDGAYADSVEHRFGTKRFKVAFEKSPTRYVNEDGTLKAGGQMPMGHR